MGVVSAALGRPADAPCTGGCGAIWKRCPQWMVCWHCPGCPLAFCPDCGPKHLSSAACKEAQAAARASLHEEKRSS